MTDQIKQLQARYDPLEDRILFKLHTENQQRLQAWITRRYLRLLLPTLQGQHPQTGQSILPQKSLAMHQAASEKSQIEADYETRYQEPEQIHNPLGEAPILLTKLTLKGLETATPHLVLEPEVGLGIQMGYQAELMGSLVKIFYQAIEAADWQLNLDPLLSSPETMTLQ